MKNFNKEQNYLFHYEKAQDYFIYRDNTREAIKELKKSIKLNPSFSQAYYDLGYIYKILDIPDRAVKYFNGYLKLKPHAKDREEVQNMIEILSYAEYRYRLVS